MAGLKAINTLDKNEITSGMAEEELIEQQELFEHYRFKADPGQSLLRIDKFLTDRIENTSRTRIQNAANAGISL